MLMGSLLVSQTDATKDLIVGSGTSHEDMLMASVLATPYTYKKRY